MSIAHWASRHARSILFLLAALAMAGIAATVGLPVSLFPHVSFPNIRVDVDAGDRPAERMTVEVTRPIEESLRSIPGVRGVKSTTSRGTCQIWLLFDWGQDMTVALLQAQSQVNKILPSLPAGTLFDVKRMDPTVFPVIAYSITSDTRSLTELHDLAEYQIRPVLSTVSGVAKVEMQGGGVEEFRVTVDPARLLAHGLTVSDVATALSASNILTAVGHLEDRDKLYLILSDTRLKTAEEISATVLHSGATGIVRLSDVGLVRREAKPQYLRANADGHEAVLFNVYQQPGGNTVQIARGIRDTLAAEQKRLPPDVKIRDWYDQSDLIVASAQSVRDAVIVGVLLAAGVLLLFLRDFKITLIAALAVPVVLAITVLVLYALNQSFNMMTLGGMAAAVGLIIDDAIVMSEHIVRRLHTFATGSTQDRVLDATDEFTKPLVGSSLSTIIIHIPPAFLAGVFGAFFGALSLSMATSLIISFLVAWLAIPVLASRWLKPKSGAAAKVHAALPARSGNYSRLMQPILRWPWLLFLVAAPLLWLGYLGFLHAPNGFMPAMDEGGFIIDYVAPPGTAVTETDRLLKQVEKILRDTPDVQTYSRRTGFSLGGDVSEANTGDFFVRLKPFPRRPIDEVVKDVSDRIHHSVPGLEFETAQLMEDLIGDLTGNPQPIVVNIYSDDEQLIAKLANDVKASLEKITGIVEVKNGLVPAGDALNVEVDRVKASLEGVDAETITKYLADLLTGSVTTQIQQGPKLVGVRVWIPKSARNTPRDIGELLLRAPDGHLFPLKRVAKFSVITGQPQITREDLKRVVSITGRIEGRDLGSVIRDVKSTLEAPGMLPAGVRYKLAGLYEQQQIAFRGLIKVISAAGGLVFLLLLFLYESFRVAVSILITTVLAMAAVFIGLWLTHTELNISSLMGMVMIVGNVTEVAIFYYSEYASATFDGPTPERLIAAGTFRLRAITMTTVAAILALLPLALGIGHGSAMLQPLAIAIIAGLIVQLPLVLVVLPALLMLSRATQSVVTRTPSSES